MVVGCVLLLAVGCVAMRHRSMHTAMAPPPYQQVVQSDVPVVKTIKGEIGTGKFDDLRLVAHGMENQMTHSQGATCIKAGCARALGARSRGGTNA